MNSENTSIMKGLNVASRQFLIADPLLSDLRGHHYNLTRLASASAKLAGMTPKWLASQDLSAELQAAHPEAIPTFGNSMYDAYKPEAGPLLRRGLLQRLLQPRPKPQLAPQEPNLVGSMFDGLVEGIKKTDAGPEDHLFFHTADGATYRVIEQLINSYEAAALPIIHLCTPYDPVGVMPNRKTAEDVAQPIKAMEERGLHGTKIHLYAENDGLAAHLSSIWDVEVSPLPLPVEESENDYTTNVARFKSDSLGISPNSFVIISLGAARLEKGFNLFPDIIRRTFELAGTHEFPSVMPENIHFALHASPQIIGRHPVIAAAIEKLDLVGADKLTLLKEPLSDTDYSTLLHSADAVCLPYRPNDYRVRSSGIVTEALAAGKFLIASQGSYPGHVAEQTHGGTGETPIEIARALLSLINEKEIRKTALDNAAKAFRNENSVERYVTRLKGVSSN